jgi:hypothetical protein
LAARPATDRLRRGRDDADILQLSRAVVPMAGASMRILEIVVAVAALGFGIILGIAR